MRRGGARRARHSAHATRVDRQAVETTLAGAATKAGRPVARADAAHAVVSRGAASRVAHAAALVARAARGTGAVCGAPAHAAHPAPAAGEGRGAAATWTADLSGAPASTAAPCPAGATRARHARHAPLTACAVVGPREACGAAAAARAGRRVALARAGDAALSLRAAPLGADAAAPVAVAAGFAEAARGAAASAACVGNAAAAAGVGGRATAAVDHTAATVTELSAPAGAIGGVIGRASTALAAASSGVGAPGPPVVPGRGRNGDALGATPCRSEYADRGEHSRQPPPANLQERNERLLPTQGAVPPFRAIRSEGSFLPPQQAIINRHPQAVG
jgi:hypothetical protein